MKRGNVDLESWTDDEFRRSTRSLMSYGSGHYNSGDYHFAEILFGVPCALFKDIKSPEPIDNFGLQNVRDWYETAMKKGLNWINLFS